MSNFSALSYLKTCFSAFKATFGRAFMLYLLLSLLPSVICGGAMLLSLLLLGPFAPVVIIIAVIIMWIMQLLLITSMMASTETYLLEMQKDISAVISRGAGRLGYFILTSLLMSVPTSLCSYALYKAGLFGTPSIILVLIGLNVIFLFTCAFFAAPASVVGEYNPLDAFVISFDIFTSNTWSMLKGAFCILLVCVLLFAAMILMVPLIGFFAPLTTGSQPSLSTLIMAGIISIGVGIFVNMVFTFVPILMHTILFLELEKDVPLKSAFNSGYTPKESSEEIRFKMTLEKLKREGHGVQPPPAQTQPSDGQQDAMAAEVAVVPHDEMQPDMPTLFFSKEEIAEVQMPLPDKDLTAPMPEETFRGKKTVIAKEAVEIDLAFEDGSPIEEVELNVGKKTPPPPAPPAPNKDEQQK